MPAVSRVKRGSSGDKLLSRAPLSHLCAVLTNALLRSGLQDRRLSFAMEFRGALLGMQAGIGIRLATRMMILHLRLRVEIVGGVGGTGVGV